MENKVDTYMNEIVCTIVHRAIRIKKCDDDGFV